MSNTALISKTALLEAFQESAQFREFALQFEAKAKQAMGDTHTVEALGTSLTLPQIAQTYQAFKGLGGFFFDNDEVTRKASFAYRVSTECLAIIKKAGYKADTEGIKALISYEPKN